MAKNINEFIRGYKIGVQEGKKDALVELQKNNKNTSLPSNEILYKIFQLLFECQEKDRKTSSCYMNSYQHYAEYITKKWEETNE